MWYNIGSVVTTVASETVDTLRLSEADLWGIFKATFSNLAKELVPVTYND